MAVPTTITRKRVREVAHASIEDIDAAVTACDFEYAVVLALARASRGGELPAETVATILPGVRDYASAVALLASTTGNRGTLLDVIRARRFPQVADAALIECITLYVAWCSRAPAELVVPEARRIARNSIGPLGYALLDTIAQGIGEENLLAATSHFRHLETNRVFTEALDADLELPADAHVESLPLEGTPIASGFTVRVGPRVGRNEACPCGSGLKFKRCCADKAAQAAPSPVAGMTWDQYVVNGAAQMSPDDVDALSLRDLARVDTQRLGDIPLFTAFRRFVHERQWARAEAAIEEVVRRKGEDGDDYRDELVTEALDVGELEIADRQLSRMRDVEGAHKLELALRMRRPEAIEQLVASFTRATQDEIPGPLVDLAHALIRAVPALGILVARGCLLEGSALDNEFLLEAIEEARDELGLPPGDAAWEWQTELEEADDEDGLGSPERDRIADEARALHTSLRVTSSRVEDLEHRLAATQRELEAARKPEATASVTREVVDPEHIRNLRTKVAELEGLVREGNVERGELRRQLATAKTTPRAAAPASRSATDDDDQLEAVTDAERGIAVPELARRVHDALATVPSAVAADALRTIGSLAAGDFNAWRHVKQAKDMVRPVMMARIGIHHRLVFRVAERKLDVIDLITRENLEATLKRMRSTRT
jgi:hypothetical protein